MKLAGHSLFTAGVAAAVFGAAMLSYALALRGVVSVWLPSGLVLGLLLHCDRRRWPAVLAGTFLGNLAVDFLHVGPLPLRILGPVVNVVEGACAAVLVRVAAGPGNPIASLRGAGALVLCGAVVANAATALLGGGLLQWTYGKGFVYQWLVWWIGDGLGMLVAAPLVLGGAEWLRRTTGASGSRRALLEAAALLLVLTAVVVVAFDRPGRLDPFLAASVFPVLILGAVRLGPGASALVFVLSIIALWFSSQGRGPLVVVDQRHVAQAEQVFAFLGIAAVSVLLLAAAIAERQRAETVRVQLQSELHQAQKLEALGRLTGGIAHDFNNLLTVLMSHADLARDQLDPGHSVREHLDEIRAAAGRSASLTRQLLGFARRQTIHPRDLSLNDAVATELDMLRRLVGEGVDLRWCPGDDAVVHMDPVQLQQVLMNLCANARDAIDGPGSIVLETSLDDGAGSSSGDGSVCLTVRDTGRGMDRVTLEHSFEPFFTTKPNGRGTGIGLASVQGIVEQNGGAVAIESEEGVGTTVRVHLPCRRGRAASPPPRSTPSPDRGRGETILLVEDDPLILRLAESALAQLGYRVVPAATPDAAIAAARSPGAPVDLMVTDVVMPGMDGIALVRHLRGMGLRPRVLYTSGYSASLAERGNVLGDGEWFLAKPYSPADLGAKVRAVLDAAV